MNGAQNLTRRTSGELEDITPARSRAREGGACEDGDGECEDEDAFGAGGGARGLAVRVNLLAEGLEKTQAFMGGAMAEAEEILQAAMERIGILHCRMQRVETIMGLVSPPGTPKAGEEEEEDEERARSPRSACSSPTSPEAAAAFARSADRCNEVAEDEGDVRGAAQCAVDEDNEFKRRSRKLTPPPTQMPSFVGRGIPEGEEGQPHPQRLWNGSCPEEDEDLEGSDSLCWYEKGARGSQKADVPFRPSPTTTHCEANDLSQKDTTCGSSLDTTAPRSRPLSASSDEAGAVAQTQMDASAWAESAAVASAAMAAVAELSENLRARLASIEREVQAMEPKAEATAERITRQLVERALEERSKRSEETLKSEVSSAVSATMALVRQELRLQVESATFEVAKLGVKVESLETSTKGRSIDSSRGGDPTVAASTNWLASGLSALARALGLLGDGEMFGFGAWSSDCDIGRHLEQAWKLRVRDLEVGGRARDVFTLLAKAFTLDTPRVASLGNTWERGSSVGFEASPSSAHLQMDAAPVTLPDRREAARLKAWLAVSSPPAAQGPPTARSSASASTGAAPTLGTPTRGTASKAQVCFEQRSCSLQQPLPTQQLTPTPLPPRMPGRSAVVGGSMASTSPAVLRSHSASGLEQVLVDSTQEDVPTSPSRAEVRCGSGFRALAASRRSTHSLSTAGGATPPLRPGSAGERTATSETSFDPDYPPELW